MSDSLRRRISSGAHPRNPPSDQIEQYPELRQLGRFAGDEAREVSRLPEIRGLTLRKGQSLGSLGKGPKSHNLIPTLAYLRGTANSSPCQQCQGPFEECVTLKGYLGHACTNCAYNDRGSRCTFRRRSKLSQGRILPSIDF